MPVPKGVLSETVFSNGGEVLGIIPRVLTRTLRPEVDQL